MYSNIFVHSQIGISLFLVTHYRGSRRSSLFVDKDDICEKYIILINNIEFQIPKENVLIP